MAQRRKRQKSDAERYFEDVVSGKVVASAKVKALAFLMLPRFENGYKQWHFDIEAARRPVRFIETECYIPSGRIGKLMKLEPFQKAIVETLFGFVDDEGFRQFQTLLVIIGRKNGKTTLMAAIELYMLIADREGAPQIYNVATSKDQASLGYGAAVKMWRQSKKMKKVVRKGTVTERHQDGLICNRNMGYITPLSSQTKHLDGLDVHCGVVDELAALTNRDVYDLVRQGIASRDQPLIIMITTNGYERDGVFDAEYAYAAGWLAGDIDDDRLLPFIWELDDPEEWTDEACWPKANPGLGTIKKVDYLKTQVNKAKQDPAYKPTVMVKDFNLPQNKATQWLTYEECVNTEKVEDWKSMGFKYGIAGIDASDTVDLSAAHVMFMRPGDDHIYERSMYWIPQDVIDEHANENRDRDDVPYRKWIARDLMRTVPGNKINKKVFVDWLQEIEREMGVYIYAEGHDRWGLDEVERDLKAFLGERNVFPIAQGAKTLSNPMKQIKADYKANRIVDDHNPVNEWCRSNVTIRTDINDNIQPDNGGRHYKNRIDGWSAEINAYVVLCDLYEDYQEIIKP